MITRGIKDRECYFDFKRAISCKYEKMTIITLLQVFDYKITLIFAVL